MNDAMELKKNWLETKKKLKKKFSKLTDNDFMLADGKQNEMINRLQVKLGLSKDEISKIISDL